MVRSLEVLAIATAAPSTAATFKRAWGKNSAFSAHRMEDRHESPKREGHHHHDDTHRQNETHQAEHASLKRQYENYGERDDQDHKSEKPEHQVQVDTIMEHLNDLRTSLKAQYRDAIAKQDNSTTVGSSEPILGSVSLESLLSEVETQSKAGLLSDAMTIDTKVADEPEKVVDLASKNKKSDGVIDDAPKKEWSKENAQISSSVNFDTVEKYLEGLHQARDLERKKVTQEVKLPPATDSVKSTPDETNKEVSKATNMLPWQKLSPSAGKLEEAVAKPVANVEKPLQSVETLLRKRAKSHQQNFDVGSTGTKGLTLIEQAVTKAKISQNLYEVKPHTTISSGVSGSEHAVKEVNALLNTPAVLPTNDPAVEANAVAMASAEVKDPDQPKIVFRCQRQAVFSSATALPVVGALVAGAFSFLFIY